MQTTPLSVRPHIALFGKVNAGKSSLFNAMLTQDASIISDQEGTTTDPVVKAMELLPFGPIALVDTAGLFDHSALGQNRQKKTDEIFDKTDFALYLADVTCFDESELDLFSDLAKKRKMPSLLVFTKCDLADPSVIAALNKSYPDAQFISATDSAQIHDFKNRLASILETMRFEKDETMLGGLLAPLNHVVLVVPIDGEAPKGRLILPQVQLLRDALDHDLIVHVSKPEQLGSLLNSLQHVDLVITDSQAFAQVNKIVPPHIALTSFSILLSRQKGDFAMLVKGARSIDRLQENARILIAEACTHTTSHEDIGQVKIPKLLQRQLNKKFKFDQVSGHQFPDTQALLQYDLVVHCGACMITRKAMLTRMERCHAANIPVTNYGLLIAKLNGILERACAIFQEDKNDFTPDRNPRI